MARQNPFSKIDMKMLIYNKVKRGIPYDQAKAELKQEIEQIINNSRKPSENKGDFNEEFAKPKNEKQG
jgi:hypothetical protein